MMYDMMIKDAQNQMKPVLDMVEVNKQATEKLVAMQSAFFSGYFNDVVAQFKALSQVKDPKQAYDLQVQYFKDLESKATNTVEQEIAVLSETKDKLSTLVEKSVNDFAEQPVFSNLKSFMPQADMLFKAPTFTVPSFAAPAVNETVVEVKEAPAAKEQVKAQESTKHSRRKTAV